MSREKLLESIRESIVNLDLDSSRKYAEEALEAGIDPKEILLSGLTEGLEIVGKRYEASEYFLSELITAEEIGKEITLILKPRLGSTSTQNLGKVVIGTVQGDLHDIGKNIVAVMLEVGGFQVLDIGADVAPEKFVETTRIEKPNIVGMSTLLTVTMQEMSKVVVALKKAQLRDNIKIVVGGAPLSEEFARSIGADGYAANAVQAVKLCKELTRADSSRP